MRPRTLLGLLLGLAGLNTTPAGALIQVGETPRASISFVDVEVVDGLAYVLGGDPTGGLAPGFLRIFDVSDPAAPVEVGSLEVDRGAADLKVVEGVAYVVSNSGFIFSTPGLWLIDVSDPTAPFDIAYFDTGISSGVDVVDGMAFVAASAGLWVIDVSDPAAPAAVSVPGPGATFSLDVEVAGGLAFLVGNGLRVVDVSDPTTPVEVGSLPGSDFRDIELAERLAYVAGALGLQVIDVSDPAARQG